MAVDIKTVSTRERILIGLLIGLVASVGGFFAVDRWVAGRGAEAHALSLEALAEYDPPSSWIEQPNERNEEGRSFRAPEGIQQTREQLISSVERRGFDVTIEGPTMQYRSVRTSDSWFTATSDRAAMTLRIMRGPDLEAVDLARGITHHEVPLVTDVQVFVEDID